jgi:hypothetical protein
MRVNAPAKIIFTIFFSEANSGSSCQKVTRENTQTVSLEIPENVVKVMEALRESKTLSLMLNIEQVYVSRDQLGADKPRRGGWWQ